MKTKAFKNILVGLLLIYSAYLLHFLFVNRAQYQWDFEMQYDSAKAFAQGGDPYDMEGFKTQSAGWYAYPPVTLWFYRLFTLMEYDTAYNVFLIFKVGMVVGLVVLWRKKFIGGQGGVWFYFFCLLGFNGAIFLDVRAGNINMLEQLLLWTGFYFFLDRRFALFCCFILLASCFKLTPVVFLGLLLLTDCRKKYLYFLGSCVVFSGYLLIQYAVSPELFRAFLVGAKSTLVVEKVIYSPSTLGLIRTIFKGLAAEKIISVPQVIPTAIFYIAAAAIVLVSARAYLVLKRTAAQDREKMLLFLACTVYTVLHPRMKDYAYVLLIPVTYFIIFRLGHLKACAFLFAITVLSVATASLPAVGKVYLLLWTHYPLVIAYLIWGLYLYAIFAAGKSGTRENAELSPG